MKNQNYLPFAIVALIAGLFGWGASTWMNRETTNAMTAADKAAAMNLQPNAAQPMQTAAQPMAATVSVPATLVLPAQPVAVAPAPNATVMPQIQARAVAHSNSSVPVNAPAVRKKGMSNKTKAAITIGGGAAVGAAIGAIAGGGKGAAIGAIAGGGSGAVYSLIRHKQKKPVF